MNTKALCFGALAIGAFTVGSTTAQAGKADFIDHYHDVFSEPDELLSAVCGFEIISSLDAHGTVRIWEDGRYHNHEQGSFVLSNPANGLTLTNTWVQNAKGQGLETLNGDGTLTIEFDDVITGIPERWRDADGKTLVKDRGRASFVGYAVIDVGDPDDPFDDQVIEFHEDVSTSGPHPILDGGGLDPSEACRFLS